MILLIIIACNKLEVSKAQTDFSTGKQEVGLLYSKSKKAKSLDSIDDFISPKKQQELLNPSQIPTLKQPTINRANPENKLLEKTKQMFEDASNF
ncbi:MAG TPA: hypothetical protein V6C71_06580 [Coleofasciculaceae cyanobacterium]|jgi:hypothetical protein